MRGTCNNGQNILPLVRHEDDVETDLFLDPRFVDHGDVALVDVLNYWSRHRNNSSDKEEDANNSNSNEEKKKEEEEVPYYGVGWYGRRRSGYGAQADEIWSIDEDVLESILLEEEEENNNNNNNKVVAIPIIDVGMAHGEKARGGALFWSIESLHRLLSMLSNMMCGCRRYEITSVFGDTAIKSMRHLKWSQIASLDEFRRIHCSERR